MEYLPGGDVMVSSCTLCCIPSAYGVCLTGQSSPAQLALLNLQASKFCCIALATYLNQQQQGTLRLHEFDGSNSNELRHPDANPVIRNLRLHADPVDEEGHTVSRGDQILHRRDNLGFGVYTQAQLHPQVIDGPVCSAPLSFFFNDMLTGCQSIDWIYRQL